MFLILSNDCVRVLTSIKLNVIDRFIEECAGGPVVGARGFVGGKLRAGQARVRERVAMMLFFSCFARIKWSFFLKFSVFIDVLIEGRKNLFFYINIILDFSYFCRNRVYSFF